MVFSSFWGQKKYLKFFKKDFSNRIEKLHKMTLACRPNIKLRLISLGLSMFGSLEVKEGKANEKFGDVKATSSIWCWWNFYTTFFCSFDLSKGYWIICTPFAVRWKQSNLTEFGKILSELAKHFSSYWISTALDVVMKVWVSKVGTIS